MGITRREFLLTCAAATVAATGACARLPVAGTARNTSSPQEALDLFAGSTVLDISGRPASVFSLTNSSGQRALVLGPDERFLVNLHNDLQQPTIVHWHGQTPPADQDGVAAFGVPMLQPGERRAYDFAARPGTYWMHSHHGFQLPELLAAPLIVRTVEDVRDDRQEVIVFLQDFSFKDPKEILTGLQGHMDGGPAMPMNGMSHAGMAQHHMDLNDVEFDAYLANDRTLADPDVIRVERRGRVKLRIVNGAASTAFHIDLGTLQGHVSAVDGNLIVPIAVSRFGLTMGQRVDIDVDLPEGDGTWPILALREGDRQQTGIILATPNATARKLESLATNSSSALSFDQELRLSAAGQPPARTPDQQITLDLGGSMHPYVWTINGRTWENHEPLRVSVGKRVEITFRNQTMMAHPMHLHGHAFQVVRFNGNAVQGALRDTILVPPHSEVAVAFDANNAGRWLLHCHNFYHHVTGMMTEVAYI